MRSGQSPFEKGRDLATVQIEQTYFQIPLRNTLRKFQPERLRLSSAGADADPAHARFFCFRYRFYSTGRAELPPVQIEQIARAGAFEFQVEDMLSAYWSSQVARHRLPRGRSAGGRDRAGPGRGRGEAVKTYLY